MVVLAAARVVVLGVRFERWRDSLGLGGDETRDVQARARRLAIHVERAAARLPGSSKCLPQAVALSWMLRSRALAHRLVVAVRPQDSRGEADDLHAMIACGNRIVLGNLPGPWVWVLVLPSQAANAPVTSLSQLQ